MTDDPPPIPILDEHDRAAVFAMIVQLVRIDVGNSNDRTMIAELQAAVDRRSASREKYVTAIDAFGFEVDTAGVWDRVKIALGEEMFFRAYSTAFPDEFKDDGKRSQSAETQPAAPMLRSTPEYSYGGAPRTEGPSPKISDAILTYLRSISGRGAHVVQIKKYLREALGIETHEKTPGMTLYRLSKNGLVRREGRLWSAVAMPESSALASISEESRETAVDSFS
jgi:hypothetical protein